MSAPYTPRILLTGATGYVGGTILNRMAQDPALASLPPITVLVRGGGDRSAKITEAYGASRVAPLAFKDLDDLDFLEEVCSQHDIIVNAATGFHPSSPAAIVRGLARRDTKESGGCPKWLVHTSGCSNIADKPITGTARPDTEWCDADPEAVYRFEKEENERDYYPQRASELSALDSAAATNGEVNAVSVQLANMCGTGEGLFQNASLIIPIVMGYVLARGHGFVCGDGTGAIDWVHISDVGSFYTLLVKHILQDGGQKIPRNEKGFIFPTVGRSLTRDISKMALDVCFAAGVLPLKDGPQEKEVRVVSLEEAATTTAGNLAIAETGWAGHRLQKGTVAREVLGWVPEFGDEAYAADFWVEFQAARAGKRGVTIGNCINYEK